MFHPATRVSFWKPKTRNVAPFLRPSSGLQCPSVWNPHPSLQAPPCPASTSFLSHFPPFFPLFTLLSSTCLHLEMLSISGSLNLPFPQPGRCLAPYQHGSLTHLLWGLCSSVTSSERPSRATLSRIAFPFCQNPLCFFIFLHNTYHPLTNVYVFVILLLLSSH